MDPKIQPDLAEKKSNAEVAAEKQGTQPSAEKRNEAAQKCECPPGCVGLPCCT